MQVSHRLFALFLDGGLADVLTKEILDLGRLQRGAGCYEKKWCDYKR